MPVPGPRNQFGPAMGFRNPDHARPDLFNHWKRPGPVYWPGRTPALMFYTLRGCVLGAGQIRRLWRQTVNLVPATPPFSWSSNSPNYSPERGYLITRALRYMTRSLYVAGGTDNSRYEGIHTLVRKENMYKYVTIGHGQVRGRPTVRNRLTSFGSRVPTLNSVATAAESQSVGASTQ